MQLRSIITLLIILDGFLIDEITDLYSADPQVLKTNIRLIDYNMFLAYMYRYSTLLKFTMFTCCRLGKYTPIWQAMLPSGVTQYFGNNK